jgi:hypothetical protein
VCPNLREAEIRDLFLNCYDLQFEIGQFDRVELVIHIYLFIGASPAWVVINRVLDVLGLHCLRGKNQLGVDCIPNTNDLRLSINQLNQAADMWLYELGLAW